MLDNLKSLLDKLINGLGDLVFAILILCAALIVASIAKNLVIKGIKALKLDEKLSKYGIKSDSFATLLAKIVWFVVFMLFMPAVFGQLGMSSISGPITNLVNNMIGFVPNLIAAGILLAVGIVLADIVYQITKPLLKATKVDLLQTKLGIKASEKTSLSAIIASVLKVLVIVFFALQALSALNLTVLNNVGAAIIAYIPKLLASLIIALVALFAGSAIEKIIVKTNPKAKGFAAVVKVIIYVVAVFMVLSQLNIASAIVETAFKYLILGVSIAIAIAFGVGGRDFAKNMLAKLEKKIDDNN